MDGNRTFIFTIAEWYLLKTQRMFVLRESFGGKIARGPPSLWLAWAYTVAVPRSVYRGSLSSEHEFFWKKQKNLYFFYSLFSSKAKQDSITVKYEYVSAICSKMRWTSCIVVLSGVNVKRQLVELVWVKLNIFTGLMWTSFLNTCISWKTNMNERMSERTKRPTGEPTSKRTNEGMNEFL